MTGRKIIYDRADIGKLFVAWLILFAILVLWNLYAASAAGSRGIPALSGIGVLYLIPYWFACLIHTLLLFNRLKAGQRFMAFPVFVVTQLVMIVTEAGSDTLDFIREIWEYDRYLLVPFLYSVVVYLITLMFRNRLQLYTGPEYLVEEE